MANKPLTDDALLEAIKSYLASHKLVTRGEMRHKLNASVARIELIAKAANINLPPKLSRSAGATLGRIKSGTCTNWFINRPAPWHTNAKPSSTTNERINP